MDFRFGGYGTDTVSDILHTLGADGRNTYGHLLVPDCVMGILYMSVLVLLNGCLLKKYLSGSRKWNWLLLCPVAAMLSDWTENLMTFCLLRVFPDVSHILVGVESVCTTLKFLLIGVSAAAAIVILIYGICASRRNENTQSL